MAATATLKNLVASLQASSASHTRADHGNVAVTRLGYVCVPWVHGTANKDIACRIYRIDEAAEKFTAMSPVIELAASGTTYYASESCVKVRTCALTDDSFVVAWERQNTAGGEAQIECARVYKSGNEWLVDQETANAAGYIIDDAPDPGDADCNPRVTYVDDGYFFISYTNETANSGTAPHVRTYQVRTNLLDWTTTGTDPVSLGNKAYANQQWDDEDGVAQTATGGYLITDSVVTRRGDILVAWENRDHDGASTYNSAIKFRLLSGLYHATPLTELDADDAIVTSTSSTTALRRPSMAGLHPRFARSAPTTDGASEVIWTYGQEICGASGATDSSQAKFGMLRLYQGGMTEVPYVWPGNTGIDTTKDLMGSSCVVYGYKFQGAFAVARYESSGGRTLVCVQKGGTGHESVTGAVLWPDRPSAVTWYSRGKEFLVLTYEGSDDGVANSSHRFVDCYLLDS